MACDFRNDGHVPNRLELQMALQVHRGIYQRMVDDGDLLVTMTSWVCKSLYQFCCAFHRFSIFSTELWGPLGFDMGAVDLAQDPVAKVLLPERLWFSEAIVMTSGFEQPEAISPRLTWSKELLVELAFPSKWTQDCMAENHITQCQVRFQNGLNGEIFCSEASLVSALYHVDRRSSVTWFLPLISLPFSGNCHYVASLRLGNEHVWSDWSDFGSSMATAMPKVWSKDQLLATKPLNCKVKLDWQQLCCDLGPIPVECVISMAMMQEGHESQQGQERLVAMTSCTAQSQKMAMPSLRDRLEVAINGFDPGVTYHFTLYARAHLPILGGGSERSDAESLSKLDFQEVARSEPFQWPSRLSEEWSCTVDWSLPFPRNLGQMWGIFLLTMQ